MIPAFGYISEKHPSVQLKLIIPKHPKSMLKTVMQLVENHNKNENISILHELPKEQFFMEISSSSAVATPSYSEGFGFTAAESITLAMPIISSGQGALKEVVSGKYIEMESLSVLELGKSMKKAFLGKWSEKPIRYFKLENRVQKYLSFYQQKIIE